jgi:chromosome segregation ATPase
MGQYSLFIALVAITLLIGCDDGKKKKALAEAAQAKTEAVKLRAETVALKGEISYLKEKLQTANQAQNKLQKQLDELLEENNAATKDTLDTQQETNNLKAMLAEQTKKAGDLAKQVEQLKAVIRELQVKIEKPKTAEPPKAEGDANQ